MNIVCNSSGPDECGSWHQVGGFGVFHVLACFALLAYTSCFNECLDAAQSRAPNFEALSLSQAPEPSAIFSLPPPLHIECQLQQSLGDGWQAPYSSPLSPRGSFKPGRRCPLSLRLSPGLPKSMLPRPSRRQRRHHTLLESFAKIVFYGRICVLLTVLAADSAGFQPIA